LGDGGFDGELQLKEIGSGDAFAVDLYRLEGFILYEILEGAGFDDGQLCLDDEFFKGGDTIDPPVYYLHACGVGGGDGPGDAGEMVFWEIGGGQVSNKVVFYVFKASFFHNAIAFVVWVGKVAAVWK
jgi:hypothetical protein